MRKKMFFLIAIVVLMATNVFAENQPTKGMVVDEHGSPLPGVSVTVKGKTIGTVTGVDGKFELILPSESTILNFSFVGYTAQEQDAKGKTELNVSLAPDSKEIDEVVVTALGIKRDKKSLGYSSNSIKSEELAKAGSPANPLTSLYGKAPGVRISATAGGPNAGMVINIRNSVALTKEANTRPLFVVDGIPIFDENTEQNRNDRTGRDRGTGINDINAEDIESMDILKGAKAAVLYGSQGANGVILITTKSGKKKKGFGVEVSQSMVWDNVAYFPKYQNVYGGGDSFGLTAANDAKLATADGFQYENTADKTAGISQYPKGDLSFGPKMNGQKVRWWNGDIRNYTPQDDNFKDMFETGDLRTTNIAFSNAGDLGSFRFSYTNKEYDGIFVGHNQKNHVASMNATFKASERVSLTFTSNYNYSFSKNAPYAMQDGLVTYGFRRDEPLSIWKNNITDETGLYWYFRNTKYKNAPSAMVGSIGAEYFWGQTRNSNEEAKHHLIQSAKLNVNILKGLNFSYTSGVDITRKNLEVKSSVTKPLASNREQGLYLVQERNILRTLNQANLTYDYNVNKDFRVQSLLGGEYQYTKDQSLTSTTRNFNVENWYFLGNSTDNIPSRGEGSWGEDATSSVLGSVQLSYKEWLFLEFQGRNDWTSILPPGNNSYFYPGASISWIASQALQLPEIISFAKARLSWADVGRPGTRYFGNLNFDVKNFGGIPYANASNELPPADFANANGKLPKEYLKNEKKRDIELGIEMKFLKNRLGFDLSLVSTTMYNQIMRLDVAPSSGVDKIRTNAGEIGTNAIELQLTGAPIKTKDFEWNATFNFSHMVTTVKSLDKGINQVLLWGVTGADNVAKIDEEYGQINIKKWKRDAAGNLIVNENGLYQFSDKKTAIGHILPTYQGGFNTNVTYKGLTLDMDFDYQFGGTSLSSTNMYMRGNGTGESSLKFRDQERGGLPYYIKNDGSKALLPSHDAKVPTDSKYDFIMHDGVVLKGVKADGSTNDKLICAEEFYKNTYWQGDMQMLEDVIYKSDYISLRRVTLSYELPKNLLKYAYLNRAKVGLFVTNVAYLYKAIPNVTPEANGGTNQFSENTGVPGVRSVGFEVKLGF